MRASGPRLQKDLMTTHKPLTLNLIKILFKKNLFHSSNALNRTTYAFKLHYLNYSVYQMINVASNTEINI